MGSINFTQPVDVTKIFENPEGVTVLTEAEIHDKVVGNTIAEVSDGKKWSEYYFTDGTLLGVWGEKRYCDYWVISGPVMCIGSGVFGFCRMYALEGKKQIKS